MNLNCFTWEYRPRYYLTHPWKWVHELGINIKNAYRRIRYGWAYPDAWNCYDWFLTVFPQLLRHIADHGIAYPGTDEFCTIEQWHDHLHALAADFESLDELTWFAQNEYKEKFNELATWHRSLGESDGCVTVSYYSDEEFNDVKEKYFSRNKELAELRQQKTEELFKTIGKHFYEYWD